MILTRAPFRVTLGGGGTDLASYYERYGGFLFAMAIDKYMYVATNPPVLDRKVRVHYTKIEVVDRATDLKHELARECLGRLDLHEKMEVSSLADLRAGVGLGSTSCYTVALLQALRSYLDRPVGRQELAEEAYQIVHDRLGVTIGKQDPYLAAFGGMTVLEIEPGGAVAVREAAVNAATLPDLIANTHLYYTGILGGVSEVLRNQDIAMRDQQLPSHAAVRDALHAIKEIGQGCLEAIEGENYDRFGELMDEHWNQKRRLSAKIGIPGIDELYETVKERFGVLGGKVAGAGGGGCFMVYAPGRHEELDGFMERHGLTRMRYGLDGDGVCELARSGATPQG